MASAETAGPDLSRLSNEELLMLNARLLESVAPRQPRVGVGEDMLRALPRGVRDGVAAVAGAPVDIANLALSGANYIGNLPRRAAGAPEQPPAQIPAGGAEDMRNWITSGARAISPTVGDALAYEPQTLPGQITRGAVEFGGAMMVPGGLLRMPASTVGKLTGTAALAGGLQEGGGQAAQALHAGPVTEGAVRAAIAGPAMWGANRSMAGLLNARQHLTEAGRSIDEPQWAAAIAREQAAKNQGVPLHGGEAFGPEGAQLLRLTGNVRASPQGAPIAAALAPRQAQVTEAVTGPQGLLSRVSPYDDPAVPMSLRTKATSADYEAASYDRLHPSVLSGNVRRIDQLLYENGVDNTLGRNLQAYRDRITTPQRGETTVRVGPISRQYQSVRDNVLPDREALMNLPPGDLAALQKGLLGTLGPINSRTASALEGASPTFARAQDTYRAMSPPVESAFIRQRLAEEFERALQSGGAGQSNPAVGARFAQNVRGREGGTRRQEFGQSMDEAGAAGGNPNLRAEAENLMETLSRTGQLPAVGSETAPRAAMAAGSRSNLISNAIGLPARVLRGEIFAGATEAATNRQLARIMASPEATQAMRTLIFAPPGSQLSQIAAANLAVTLRAATQPPALPPPSR